MRKSELIEFLNEYDEEDYEIRITDDYGHEATVETTDWANGPWIVLKDFIITSNSEVEEYLRWKFGGRDA